MQPTQEELEDIAYESGGFGLVGIGKVITGDKFAEFARRIIDWHNAKLAEQEPVALIQELMDHAFNDGCENLEKPSEATQKCKVKVLAMLYAAPTPPADNTKDVLIAARDALERFASWGRMQHKAQSKGGHATFDLLVLRDEVEAATEALAKINAALGETK